MDPDGQKQCELVMSALHREIVDYAEGLFSRQSLRKNLYLTPKMTVPLQLPLFVIAEERKIAQMTHDSNILTQALQLCDLVHVLPEKRVVQIIEYPTVKVERKYASILGEFEMVLKEYIEKEKLGIKFYISKQANDDGYFYIILKDTTQAKMLDNLLDRYNKDAEEPLPFHKQHMWDDLKEGIQKQKKIKKQTISKQQMNKDLISPDRPQTVFIRRAVESEEQQEEQKPKVPKKQQNKPKTKKNHKQYKQAKLMFEDKDFPSLP